MLPEGSRDYFYSTRIALWQNIYNLIEDNKIYSVSEVQLELSKSEDFPKKN